RADVALRDGTSAYNGTRGTALIYVKTVRGRDGADCRTVFLQRYRQRRSAVTLQTVQIEHRVDVIANRLAVLASAGAEVAGCVVGNIKTAVVDRGTVGVAVVTRNAGENTVGDS